MRPSSDRPIAIVVNRNERLLLTISQAKQLLDQLQAAIAEYDAKSSRPPRPQPKYDSGVWERRPKWWRGNYEGGRS